MKIRPAHAKDVDAVVALERATEHAPRWQRRAYSEILVSKGPAVLRCLIVGEWGDEAGAAACGLAGFAVGAVQNGASELESVALAAGAKRNGIGRMLCEALIAWSRRQGASEMTLEVRASNAAAIALYTRLGFNEAARRPRYYRDPEEDAVVM